MADAETRCPDVHDLWRACRDRKALPETRDCRKRTGTEAVQLSDVSTYRRSKRKGGEPMSNHFGFSSRPVTWAEHWTNGGTGISKGCGADIAESVRQFGNKSIWMRADELHSSRRDLSDFWQFHRARTGKDSSVPDANEKQPAPLINPK